MTPEERAGYNISLDRRWNTDEQIRKSIADQIREAVNEAQQRIVSGWDAAAYVSQARAEAYEHAAKIAENHAIPVMDGPTAQTGIAQAIRARATEVKNEKGF